MAGGRGSEEPVAGFNFGPSRALSGAGRVRGFQLGRCASIRLDFVEFPQRKAYIVESLEQSPCGVIVNLERQQRRSGGDVAILKIHSDFQPRLLLDQLPQQFHIILGNFCRQ